MKTFRLFSIAALVLAMAACSSEENTLETQSPAANGKLHFTATIATPDNGSGTRTEYSEQTTDGTINVAWKENDKIAAIVINSENKHVKDVLTVSKVNTDGSAVISGDITKPKDGEETVDLIYPADIVTVAADGSDYSISFEKMSNGTLNGTLESIANNIDYRRADDCPLTVSGEQATLTSAAKLESKLSIWKLTLQNTSGANLNATKVTIKDGSDIIAATKDISATSEVHMAVPFTTSPATFNNLTIEATVGSDTYAFSKTGLNLTAGKYYQSTVKMARTLAGATTSDYGKVVCAAGHLHDAKTAVPAGCTAVGILGKVTETGHGLILALQDAYSQSWTDINGWTSASYAGTTLKVLTDDDLGNLTSYTTLGATAVSNWAVAQKSDYEAIFINLGSQKHDNEGYTYDAKVNEYITTGVGGTALSGGSERYWSATESGVEAWAFESDSWSYNNDKNAEISVRPVLGF